MKIVESTDLAALQRLKERKVDFERIVNEVRPIVRDVAEEGDAAIRRYTRQFDKREWMGMAVGTGGGRVSPALRKALQQAKENIVKFHAAQMPKEWWTEIMPGIEAGQLVRPLGRVGCYIPGGRYPLVSTVLMTALPARIAGVGDIVVCTPRASAEILYACELCGVKEVFEVGGAMAIAAMAYGTKTIPKVEKIVGPGNLYVSAAKKIVYGDVGIDFIAGPSEVVIIADDKASPSYISADLLAQAEHDPSSMALCITPSRDLAERVVAEMERRLEVSPTAKIARESLESRGAVILVGSLEEAFALSNRFAPEHLEIQVEDAERWLGFVESAGSIFLGAYAPESAGDYASGTNHVLPTGGAASRQSGLNVRDFIKTPSVQRLSKEGLFSIAATLTTLAEAEGLMGHAESVKARFP